MVHIHFPLCTYFGTLCSQILNKLFPFLLEGAFDPFLQSPGLNKARIPKFNLNLYSEKPIYVWKFSQIWFDTIIQPYINTVIRNLQSTQQQKNIYCSNKSCAHECMRMSKSLPNSIFDLRQPFFLQMTDDIIIISPWQNR